MTEHIILVENEEKIVVGKDLIQIQASSINFEELVSFVSDDMAGAISTFSGTTRSHYNGKQVLKLEYEAYVPMAEKEMKAICKEIREKWKVLHVALVHRYGIVPIKEASVVIAVSSIHRSDSIEAAEYAINEIKARVPIWKKEFYLSGEVWKENEEWRKTHACVSHNRQKEK